MATEEQIQDIYIDPRQNWQLFKQKIELPEVFSIFTDNSIEFVESGKRFIDKKKKKEMDFDKYVKPMKTVSGKIFANKYFMAYYDDKGNLSRIEMVTVKVDESVDKILDSHLVDDKNKINYLVLTITNIKLTKDLPTGANEIPEGCKVYGPNIGDMNDLIEQPPLIKEY